MKAVVPILVFYFVMAAVLIAMASFDRLIRWLHTSKRDEWLALGSPAGYLFQPEGLTFGLSDSRKTALAFRWFFSAPRWIAEGKELSRALWIYRGAGSCVIAGLIALVVLL